MLCRAADRLPAGARTRSCEHAGHASTLGAERNQVPCPPSALVHDVGLEEHRHAASVCLAACQRSDIDEPLSPGFERERQLRNIRQRRHDRDIGSQQFRAQKGHAVTLVDNAARLLV